MELEYKDWERRTITINRCKDCPFHRLGGGEYYCLKLDIVLPKPNRIPTICPLPKE